MTHQQNPNFSTYRKQFDLPTGDSCQLHILYMKSNQKAISRNFTAPQLELYCSNRFYGPLVVALNLSKPPNYLMDFNLQTYGDLEKINLKLNAKSIKDDFVLDCLLNAKPFNENLNMIYKTLEVFTFYMFRYKSCWCPNRKKSHDSKSCIFAHHMRDFRRPPEIFNYSSEDCEAAMNNKDSEYSWELCPNGLLCNKSHTTVERLYHPDKYKRINCDRGRCNKSEICAFYHNQQERNYAMKMCKNYRKEVHNKKYDINLEVINKEILKFYQQSKMEHLGEDQ